MLNKRLTGNSLDSIWLHTTRSATIEVPQQSTLHSLGRHHGLALCPIVLTVFWSWNTIVPGANYYVSPVSDGVPICLFLSLRKLIPHPVPLSAPTGSNKHDAQDAPAVQLISPKRLPVDPVAWFPKATQVPVKKISASISRKEWRSAGHPCNSPPATKETQTPFAPRPKKKQSASLKHVAVGRSKRVCSCSNSQNALSFCIA